MNNGVKIQYGDIAPGAKEAFIATTNSNQFDTLGQLQKDNLVFPNYSNPMEFCQTPLDGSAKLIPSRGSKPSVGLWSVMRTNDEGNFPGFISLVLESADNYTSGGISFTFDEYAWTYPTRLSIKWSRIFEGEETVLSEMEFFPDSAFYFCENRVEYYNRLEIKFYSMNMPLCRLKLRAIDYGRGTVFNGNELGRVKISHEIDPISSEILIGTSDFEILSKSGYKYDFQKRQPISIYFNGELVSTTFIKSYQRKSKYAWSIESEDYIGSMDSVPFSGGVYSGSLSENVIEEIFATAKVPYVLDDSLRGVALYGHIPYSSCRDSLMQVLFAIQAVALTDRRDHVFIGRLESEEDIKQTIPVERIMQGQSFSADDSVSAVDVYFHSYEKAADRETLYSAAEKGTGEEIFVQFDSPVSDLSISNGSIIFPKLDSMIEGKVGVNYAIINADSENCSLTGKKFIRTSMVKRTRNPLVLSTDPDNIVEISNATLIWSGNIDSVSDAAYKWLVRRNRTNTRIVEGKRRVNGELVKDDPVNIGDFIAVETEYLGTVSGRVISQSFSLVGGTTVKETVIK